MEGAQGTPHRRSPKGKSSGGSRNSAWLGHSVPRKRERRDGAGEGRMDQIKMNLSQRQVTVLGWVGKQQTQSGGKTECSVHRAGSESI